MQIEVATDAMNFLRARGSELYTWENINPDTGDRTLRISYKPPRGHRDFVRYERPGLTFFREASVLAPRLVFVSLGRWPWAYLRVRFQDQRVDGQASPRDMLVEGLDLLLLVALAGFSTISRYALFIFPLYLAVEFFRASFAGLRSGD